MGFGEIQKVSKDFTFFPDTLHVLHWHGDTFTLPKGAILLYSTEACVNQAFIYNKNVVGLQFHLETTTQSLAQLVEVDKDYIKGSIYKQTAESILNTMISPENERTFMNILEYLKNS
ncbi:type 1 glutamine amidotransferase [Neobacillus ginsengisoli]|uniref:GMP synthase-like glutamine amidotransferase n=1 Tax=Neobacillus ginsengisoli TaxID=904295 RepID=A0ABT9Y2M3_9BACI|nr:hypothetical protein [Neobacillus ginsengisoli]MDQ0202070.1 GMP synthase-like glutamine amidotransferase [Neobacillus ginsengisoli]